MRVEMAFDAYADSYRPYCGECGLYLSHHTAERHDALVLQATKDEWTDRMGRADE